MSESPGGGDMIFDFWGSERHLRAGKSLYTVSLYHVYLLNLQLVKVLNRSWPAVSQIVSFTCLPPMLIILALKSTPATARNIHMRHMGIS